jgi:LuxR family transcriptional regulator, maltose regulon positive regulatory protein
MPRSEREVRLLDASRSLPGGSLMEHKLHRPPARDEWVARPGLLEAFARALEHQVVLVCAPAGYGKTTMLAQYADRPESPAVAWVTLDPGDNDPARFWSHVAAALVVSGCAADRPTAWPPSVNGAAIMSHALPQLLNGLAAVPEQVVIVLDDLHRVDEPACHAQLDFFIAHLPKGTHLVISARSEPPLRLGRLRASGELGEVHASQLAFTVDEAADLLAREHVRLSGTTVDQLVKGAEGWPAGIYLAALALERRSRSEAVVTGLGDGNRFVEDYLTEEVLSLYTEDVRRFILDVSVLDRFTAELCDAIIGGSRSARILRELERTNPFLVPLMSADHSTWFRFHHLLAAVARTELESTRPDRIAVLHARAAAWFTDRGHIDDAFRHLVLAGDRDGATLLAETHWMTHVDAGRQATVRSWLDALGPPHHGSDPARIVVEVWMAALSGDGAAFAEHVRSLQPALDHGPLPDGSRSVESAIAITSAVFGYGGRGEVVRHGRRAVELEDDARSPFHALAALAAGHGAYLDGDSTSAAGWLDTAAHHPAAPVLVKVVSGSLASIVEAERGDHASSRRLAEAALRLVEDHGLGQLPQSSLAYSAWGRVQAADGGLTTALATLEHGLALRRRLNRGLGPWATIHHLMIAAPVAARAGEHALADELLEELIDLVDRFDPGSDGPVRARLAEAQLVVRRPRPPVGGEPLTPRELHVLRLLAGSAPLSVVARQLHVSANTVKTHCASIYRKLGARSRDEAVRLARKSGLL